MTIAFQTSIDDIVAVLDAYAHRVVDDKNRPHQNLAETLITQIDTARVEKAALNAGTDLDVQSQAAFDEIKDILVELGVLDF